MGIKQWAAFVNLAFSQADRYKEKRYVYKVPGIGWICSATPKDKYYAL